MGMDLSGESRWSYGALAQADFHGRKWPLRSFYDGHRKAGFEDVQLWEHGLTTPLAEKWVEWQFGVTLKWPHNLITRSVVERCADWIRKNVPNAMWWLANEWVLSTCETPLLRTLRHNWVSFYRGIDFLCVLVWIVVNKIRSFTLNVTLFPVSRDYENLNLLTLLGVFGGTLFTANRKSPGLEVSLHSSTSIATN